MSEMAKKAREAMKAKAKSLSSADPSKKVDSSTWTPPEPLNTEVKTGLRPISRRAFKKGGKVMGEDSKCDMGRKPRKSGGQAKAYAIAKINRNVKEANEERDGIKHVGGMKKGGRAAKQAGGSMPPRSTMERLKDYFMGPPKSKFDPNYKDPAGGPSDADKAALNEKFEEATRKRGGRTHKMDGGGLMKFQGDPVIPGMKKGGKAHTDEKMDIALIKKMVKPSARSARKEGGGVFSGPSYPGKIPGVVPGGREARAMGGKAKKGNGKTNINIVIAAGKPADGADMMGPAGPMGGPTRPPGGLPVPVPPPQGGAPMPPAAMPMPMPMPQAPAGGPPVPRKSGGRLTKVAKSYKDMTAGAGSGEGRLQKTDIAKARMGRKAGGKTYRSYKDMDAGAGSGLGRLEKTEIQAHKR